MRRFAMLVALAPTLAVAGASDAAPNAGTIGYTLKTPPMFLAATPACPAARARTLVHARSGSKLGKLAFCTKSTSGDVGPGARFIRIGVATFSFAAGTIVVSYRFVDLFNADGSLSQHTGTGRVTGGTGRYVRARGTLAEKGTQSFPQSGLPRPKISGIITLR